jgi:DtxR family Mn-dependent transcriptional regulator
MVTLTDEGVKRAEVLVRGHRLAQRLMVDVLGISPENANKVAHYMEHIVDPEVLDAISAFLGYPESSPDGKKIPLAGGKKILSIKPVLYKLADFPLGKTGRIRYIQNPERSLSHIGIMPGEKIKMIQKKPSVILELGHTTIALDTAFAKDIYIQPDLD